MKIINHPSKPNNFLCCEKHGFVFLCIYNILFLGFPRDKWFTNEDTKTSYGASCIRTVGPIWITKCFDLKLIVNQVEKSLTNASLEIMENLMCSFEMRNTHCSRELTKLVNHKENIKTCDDKVYEYQSNIYKIQH